MKKYFNLPSVKKAMHVPDKEWAMCNDDIYDDYHSAPNSS